MSSEISLREFVKKQMEKYPDLTFEQHKEIFMQAFEKTMDNVIEQTEKNNI